MTEPSAELLQARETAAKYTWREAFDLFATADALDPLGPQDLELMAECAWWIGKMRHCIALRERAHAEYVKAGANVRAAYVAADLGQHHADLMEAPTAQGWIQRGERLLEGAPENPVHGWLELARFLVARSQNDGPEMFRSAESAAQIAGRQQDRDLFALAHAVLGMGLVASGEPERGLRMVQEATQGAVSGELSPRATGSIYCLMISANAHLADWQSAGEWTEAAVSWCNRQAINGFPGVCRVHRAEILRLRGDLVDAEEEARTATTELGSFNLLFAAQAFRELGEVRLRMGELDLAEEAFLQADEMGVSPQPGLALVQVERGRPEAGARSLRRALADRGLGPLDRARLLPAQVEVSLALGDSETALAAAQELSEIADGQPTSPALRAAADIAFAAVGLAQGELEPAAEAARNARKVYDDIDLTYFSARASLLLGEIQQARGDTEGAATELGNALAALEQIGAVPDAARARRLLSAPVA